MSKWELIGLYIVEALGLFLLMFCIITAMVFGEVYYC